MTLRVRRNLARALGIVLVGLALALFAGGPAGADEAGPTPAAKGWWWQAQQLPAATIPAPPNVKPGQLDIQGSPSDAKGAAFAALRYTLAADQTTQQLTLTVADSTGVPVLLACKTASTWAPAEAGAWSAAPQVDTKACSNGTAAPDGKTWTFPVSTLQAGGVLDIAIVPGVDATTHAPAPFSLVFDAPTAGALTVAAGAPSTVTPLTSSAPAPSPSAAPAAATSTGVAVKPVAAPTPAPTGLPGDKVATPADNAATAPVSTDLAAANASTDRDKRAGYAVLAIAAAVALYAWRQDNLIAMNGGKLPGMADQPVGLGRFSQTRQGSPPALT